MVTIKDGYNGKELRVKINANSNGTIDLWIEQDGLPETPELVKYRETLSYMTADELLALKKEVENAARDLFGY